MSTNNNEKSTPWLLYAVIIVGCSYIITSVATQLSHPVAAPAISANGPAALRPCLELTSDEGIARDGYGRILGSVRNNCQKQFRYVEVEFKLYDSSGDVVGAAMTNLAALGPYENWKFEAIAMQPYTRYQLAHVAGD